MSESDKLHESDRIRQKLDWIAKLSKDSSLPGVPDDPDAVRALLNRIVKDVRDACALLSDRSDGGKRLHPYGIADATPEVAANTLICLADQEIYLLKRQIERLEHDFVEEGGFTEKLYRVRLERRGAKQRSRQLDTTQSKLR